MELPGPSPLDRGEEVLGSMQPGWFLLADPSRLDMSSQDTHLLSHVFGSWYDPASRLKESPSHYGLDLSDRFQEEWEKRVRTRKMQFWSLAESDPRSVEEDELFLLLRIHGKLTTDRVESFAEAPVGDTVWRLNVPEWYAELFCVVDHSRLVQRLAFRESDAEPSEGLWR